ncbi:MAG TPA: methyltransferase domain-containing protein [Mobilitalea sp.]|nr:methyltransferase domain-containing protein [Mobilitalea sp.]
MRKFILKDKYNTLIQGLIDDYNKDHSQKYIMGPDALCLIEILCERMELKPGMRVLDMGCGAGFTSIILVKEYGVTVFANDLWASASENYERFVKAGVDKQVFPFNAEAHNLPFASNFFDAAISIDAYHYFGTDECYLCDHYARLVKQGGQFGLVNPGLTREFTDGLPEEMKPLWEPNMYAWHSAEWWQSLWQKSNLVNVTYAKEIPEGKAIWRMTADYELHDADIDNYLTLMLMTATKK